MKHIKLKFTDFWAGFDYYDNFITKALACKYEIELSDNPDYVFCSVFGHDYLKYPNAIRIIYTGENMRPDLNLFDYAIGFDWFNCRDRYMRFPLYALYSSKYQAALQKHLLPTPDIRSKKFCNFVYSNGQHVTPVREQLFDALSQYRPVDSGGRYRNNIGGPVADKLEFLRQYKFTIAVENTDTSGYTTEKIIEAWAAGTIPIYYGNPDIGCEFNSGAFVDVRQYSSLEELVSRVKEIDQNDSLYLQMLSCPIIDDTLQHSYSVENDLVPFLCYILDQPKNNAFRRDCYGWGRIYENEKCFQYSITDSVPIKLLKKIKRIY